MRKLFSLRWIATLILVAGLPATADLQDDLASLQEAWLQRKAAITTENEAYKREIVDKFTTALDRIEAEVQATGDLDGVVKIREVKEAIAESKQIPAQNPAYPENLNSMIGMAAELFAAQDVKRVQSENQLNAAYVKQLDSFIIEFTKIGELEIAMELKAERDDLVNAGAELVPGTPVAAPKTSNEWTIKLEPAYVTTVPDLPARKSPVKMDLERYGETAYTPRGIQLFRGAATITKGAGVFAEQVAKSGAFTIEVGFRPNRGRQGREERPIHPMWLGEQGEKFRTSLSIQQIDRDVFMTIFHGSGETRVLIGSNFSPDRYSHLVISARNGFIQVFRDGKLDKTHRVNFPLPKSWGKDDFLAIGAVRPKKHGKPWVGTIHSLYMKPSPSTEKDAQDSYERFKEMIKNLPKDEVAE